MPYDFSMWHRWCLLGLASLAVSCGDDKPRKSGAQRGCELACSRSFECDLMQPLDNAAEICGPICSVALEPASDACKTAYQALGDCAFGLDCVQSGQECQEEFAAVGEACNQLSTQQPDLAAGVEPAAAAPSASSPAPLDSCADYEFQVTGLDCTSPCPEVTCDCDPFPTSLVDCTPNGCITSANCDVVCRSSSLADVFNCDYIYTLPDGSVVNDEAASGELPGQTPEQGTTNSEPLCQPLTCAAIGATCGTLDDGCGQTLQCGLCSPPESCGGGGVDNQCGCMPITCEAQGVECGTVEDGCGALIDCGGCADGQWCGGAGQAGRCGCSSAGVVEGYANRGASLDGIGTMPWEGTQNLVAIDGGTSGFDRNGNASVNLTSGDVTQWLVASDFQLQLPAAASIQGIEVHVQHRGYSLGAIADNAVRLVSGGSILDYDLAVSEDWGTMAVAQTYGGPAEPWGRTWTAAELSDPSFGVALSARYTTSAGNSWALVDAIWVTVHYSATCP